MKKIIASALIIMIITTAFCVAFAEENSEKTLGARSPHAIVVDMKTGAAIYEKKATEKVYPAGLTRIMTAVLVLENCNIEELATASETALANVESGDSKIGIVNGERLSVRQLLYGMLLASAADAANVLAEQCGGSIENFVAQMNEKAKVLGMKNTNFTNPTGAHDERHYTTAQDMAKLAVYAMKINEFREIVKTDSYSIPPTEKSTGARKVTNRNHFVSRLLRNDYYYQYSTGIGTGYTAEAKSCIAASAQKRGMELIALVFEAETVDNIAQSFSDCANMFDYIFDNFSVNTIVSEKDIVAQTRILNTRRQKKLILKAEKSLDVIVEKGKTPPEITYEDTLPDKISAPVRKGQKIGVREYFMGGTSVGTVDLIADKNYNLDPVTFVINKMIAFVTSPWLFVFIAFVIFVLIMAERRRRRILRKKRRDARKKRNRELLQEIES